MTQKIEVPRCRYMRFIQRANAGDQVVVPELTEAAKGKKITIVQVTDAHPRRPTGRTYEGKVSKVTMGDSPMGTYAHVVFSKNSLVLKSEEKVNAKARKASVNRNN